MNGWIQDKMAIIGTSLTGAGISIAGFLDSIPNQIPAAILGIATFTLMCVMIFKSIREARKVGLENKRLEQQIEQNKQE